MTAPELREAAALMRERAKAADSQGAWEVGMRYSRGADWIRPVYDNDGTVCEIHEGDADDAPGSCEDLAAHIASWHPVVALAVADWLEQMARGMAGTSYGDLPFEDAALAVARAYLGTEDPS